MTLDLTAWALLAAIGGLSGFTAGLMGIGGGLIVVPSLIYALPHIGVAGPDVPKIATATSLALVIPTALASAQAHAARGAVSLKYAAILAPAIMIGAFGAAALAQFIDGRVIIVVFAAYAAAFAWGLLREPKAKAAPKAAGRGSSDIVEVGIKSVGGGALASLGFGGGFFCVPILSRFVPMTTAIGTGAALGLPLATAGVVAHLAAPTPASCAAGCAGTLYLPAIAAIGGVAVLAAPAGAAVAHVLPAPILRRIFAALLLLNAFAMSWRIIPPLPAIGPAIFREAGARLLDPVCRPKHSESDQIALRRLTLEQGERKGR
jgi:uncharacterized protein